MLEFQLCYALLSKKLKKNRIAMVNGNQLKEFKPCVHDYPDIVNLVQLSDSLIGFCWFSGAVFRESNPEAKNTNFRTNFAAFPQAFYSKYE